MGCELPLVLFNEPNMKDLLKWDNGIYVEQDPDAIRKEITGLLGNKMERRRMGANGRRGVEEELSVEIEAKDLLNLYK